MTNEQVEEGGRTCVALTNYNRRYRSATDVDTPPGV